MERLNQSLAPDAGDEDDQDADGEGKKVAGVKKLTVSMEQFSALQ